MDAYAITNKIFSVIQDTREQYADEQPWVRDKWVRDAVASVIEDAFEEYQSEQVESLERQLEALEKDPL